MSDTWNKLLEDAAEGDQIIAKAPDDPEIWDRPFDANSGRAEGAQVLAWSREFVYFPVAYDGMEWMDRAPRNPRPAGQPHVERII